jgi:hypothetical protein
LAYRIVRVLLQHKNEQYRHIVCCVEVNTAHGIFNIHYAESRSKTRN